METHRPLDEQLQTTRLFDPGAIHQDDTTWSRWIKTWQWRGQTVRELIAAEERIKYWLERMQATLSHPGLDPLQEPQEIFRENHPKGLSFKIASTHVDAGLFRGRKEEDGIQGIHAALTSEGVTWSVDFPENGPFIVGMTLAIKGTGARPIEMTWSVSGARDGTGTLQPKSMTVGSMAGRHANRSTLTVRADGTGMVCGMAALEGATLKGLHEVAFDCERHTKPVFPQQQKS